MKVKVMMKEIKEVETKVNELDELTENIPVLKEIVEMWDKQGWICFKSPDTLEIMKDGIILRCSPMDFYGQAAAEEELKNLEAKEMELDLELFRVTKKYLRLTDFDLGDMEEED